MIRRKIKNWKTIDKGKERWYNENTKAPEDMLCQI